MRKIKICFVLGTRPEAIKLAPVILSCNASPFLEPIIIYTSQHKEMGQKFLDVFDIPIHYILPPPPGDRSLGILTSHILEMLEKPYHNDCPGLTIVQGDTTSALCGALNSFYHKVPVAHVEAGLRTYSPLQPFPEEMNRTIIGRIARLHFAPTITAHENLLREGINHQNIELTGNTVVDALHIISSRTDFFQDKKLREAWESDFDHAVTVTAHRRENWEGGVRRIALALQDLTVRFPRTRFFFSIHPNPHLRREVEDVLGDTEGIILLDALGYEDFILLLSKSSLAISDSGGVQEEAPSLGVPVVVTREHTERPEVIEAGWGVLVGADRIKIFEAVCAYLEGKKKTGNKTSLFGDGRASNRIVFRISEYLGCTDTVNLPRPPPWPSTDEK